MATDVVMPQMGESIAEGTIVRWIKKVGDKVDRDEPLFEISTDKVDAEIPSPAAGVVSEIRVQEGETVPVNSVVAVIGSASAADTAPAAPAVSDAASKPAAVSPQEPPVQAAKAVEPPKASAQADGAAVSAAAPPPHYHDRDEPDSSAPPAASSASDAPKAPSPPAAGRPEGRPLQAETSTPATVGAGLQTGPGSEDAIRERSSPLVRKIAKEHNVDIAQIHGTGIAGRVTKDDILGFIDKGAAGQAGQVGQVGQVGRSSSVSGAPPVANVTFKPGAGDHIEKMSVMRKRIAEHMVLSKKTSAHVHSVFEVNFGRIAKIRDAKKAEFERAGAKLTYMSFIIKAAIDALRAVPIVNASVDGENIVYHKDINVGIAVALDWGLIVPVIKHADEKNLIGLSRAVIDLANRARGKQLKPDDVAGGTFTITNPGVFGALFGMPIISQPQVAILGVGNVEKRPVVVDDAIAIRPMAYLTLGYDHRVIDGAVADEFMSILKKSLENWDPNSI
jgi:pyruvate dehydrogenase E2 component (dihydrolipoyllysine-residue acetyltransferase)